MIFFLVVSSGHPFIYNISIVALGFKVLCDQYIIFAPSFIFSSWLLTYCTTISSLNVKICFSKIKLEVDYLMSYNIS